MKVRHSCKKDIFISSLSMSVLDCRARSHSRFEKKGFKNSRTYFHVQLGALAVVFHTEISSREKSATIKEYALLLN